VDEAERAVVVTGADPVEDRSAEHQAERHPGVLVDGHEALHPPAPHLELHPGLVGLELVADDVAHGLAVHGEKLVTGAEPHRRRR